MMNKERLQRRPALRWSLVVVLMLTVSAACASNTATQTNGQRQTIQVGRTAPAFTAKTLDGQTLALQDLRGKRLLLNFWASWCEPCKKEMPDFDAAFAELKDQNIAFVGIGTQDRLENLKAFADQIKVSYPLVDDTEGVVGDSYGVLGLPTTVFVDSSGVIQRVQVGPLTKADVLRQFAEMK